MGIDDLLEILKDAFGQYDWSANHISNSEYRILCNNKETKYKFCEFGSFFIPSFLSEQKEMMSIQNIKGIMDRIKNNGVEFINI